MLLPDDELAFAELKNEGKEQQLRLVFAMHEVLVRGHSLRRIETAMQRSELSLLTALCDKQRSFQMGSPWFLKLSFLSLRHKKRRFQTAYGEQPIALHNSSKKLRMCARRRRMAHL